MEVVMKEGEVSNNVSNNVQNSGSGPDLDQTRMIQKRARNELPTQEYLDRRGKNPNMVQNSQRFCQRPECKTKYWPINILQMEVLQIILDTT